MKEKGKEKKKERGEEKKAMVALLVFVIIATLEIVFGRKKLLDAEGPFGDNIIKNLDCKTVRIFAYSSTLYAQTFNKS